MSKISYNKTVNKQAESQTAATDSAPEESAKKSVTRSQTAAKSNTAKSAASSAKSAANKTTANTAKKPAANKSAAASTAAASSSSAAKTASTAAKNSANKTAANKSAATKTASKPVAKAAADTNAETPKIKTTTYVATTEIEGEKKAETNEEVVLSDIQSDDKEQYFKYFRKHPNYKINTKVDRFTPDLKKGLTTEQVKTRFSQFLFNENNKQYSKSYASIFISNICTFFNLLCLIAFVALILAKTSGFTNYLVIFMTTANICVGIIQEIRSKRSIDKLSLMAANTAKVLRDGEITEIPLNEIVLDDIIILETGNQVPADCILAEGSVEVNESLLTGESISIKKKPGDLLYAGSFVSSGNGKFRVDKVGKETYLQKLTSKAKKYKKPNSELMNSTKLIIKVIGLLIIPVAIGIFITTYNNYDPTSEAAKAVSSWIFSAQTNYAIQRTCSVVIGMIPSGMLLLTSIALAVGVIRLARQNTLVQDLYSLEMLARVNVLCLDKTGTITDGRMRVNDCIILNPTGENSINEIMGSMLSALDDNNQTSIALYNHFGYSDKLSPVSILPFSSARKLSAVTFEDAGTFAFGAPEFVLRPLPAKVDRITKQYAQMGMRVLVLAHSSSPISGDKLPSNMRPVAIISIADNIREDAITTIKWFKDNDVAVKVISGDNPVTVSEVARRAGVTSADKFISLEGLSDQEVENVAKSYTVFGRVTPEQKAILIRAIKAEGNTVAMTGDGVNDILAMKEADCAISVASGSEAARNMSHIVLMDNNFNSMPKVVAEGRRVINNIKNSSSLFLMKTLFTCILALLCIFMNTTYLFLPKNVLLLELCIIGIPSFFLSLQPNNSRVQGKFISHVMSRSIPGAVLMVICVMAMYLTNVFAPDEFGGYYLAMCMLALTFSGFVMLYRVCQPFNWYRGVLYVAVLGISILCCCVPALGDLIYDDWSKLEWDYSKILIVVVVVEAAFPISSWLIKIMEIIMPSSTGKEKPKLKDSK